MSGPVTVFDGFPPAVFRGIHFPVESSRIEGGMRDHVHEYPHTPGGDPELLARSLYQFHVVSKFDANFASYPGLYPDGLDALLGFFEQGVTATDFRLPQMISAVPAYARKWSREMSNRVRSGETVEFELIENQSSLFLLKDVTAGTSSVETNMDAVNNAAIRSSLLSAADQNSFSSLQNAVASLLAVQDQANLYDQRIQDGIAQVISLCTQLDQRPSLQTVAAYPILQALHELWASAITLQQDVDNQGAQLQTWIVPSTMSVASLAAAIYAGDSSRASDLLSLNPFPDPMQVVAGTSVLFYPVAA